jgi:hemolysin III
MLLRRDRDVDATIRIAVVLSFARTSARAMARMPTRATARRPSDDAARTLLRRQSTRMHALTFPTFTPGERTADRFVHALGIVAVAAGVPLLVAIAADHGALTLAGVLPYGLGAIAMIVVSALYNLAPPSHAKEILRRVDHSVIFVMIAGTYTPFVLCRVGGAWGIGLLACVWLVAVGGVVLKLAFPRRFERVSIVLYLALGWSILLMLAPMVAALSTTALALIGIGGALYSLGVVFHLCRRLPYHNAIWHALVLAAASCHYAAVMIDVALAAS